VRREPTDIRTARMLARSVLAVTGTLMLMGSAPVEAQEPFRIIVNPANRTSSLSTSQLSKLFLEPATWEDGQPVLPVDLNSASPVRELFSKEVHGMATPAVVAHWTRSAAAGAKTPPTFASDADVIQYVRLKLGGIGYVSAAADVSQVKVLSIVRRSTEAGTVGSGEHILNVLRTYTAALEGRNVDGLKRIWPTMSASQERAIRAEFDHARSMRVELLDPRIDVKEDKAVVLARRRYAVTTAEGTQLQSEAVTTLNLRRATSGWVIEDIRYQAAR
jgi:hypothetical protein